jgi:hypothetical protein
MADDEGSHPLLVKLMDVLMTIALGSYKGKE